MYDKEVIKFLQNNLHFSTKSIKKLQIFINALISANKKHNFISKTTEVDIWHRHVLDSAQLVKFIDFSKGALSDLGSGAGFPGLVLAIFNENKNFHVKLYEKSPVKRAFLEEISKSLSIKVDIAGNVYEEKIDTEYVVSRAFKKLENVIQVSREIAKKPHKMIVLKGQNAQEEINKALKIRKYDYKLEKSVTNSNSRIIIMNIK
ncbi:16S rRNA (guanine(527)-N(7))-methyltransferase RsmG [Candidatus Pelagibacter bacterium]|nr:16S rRNA (guanine(527)-N(7))-methyltransferase RsmG [Candidatus Pelagibacter bacterium]